MKTSVRTSLLVTAIAAASFVGGVIAAQPHMNAAADDLSAAKSQLQAATWNKGGHRAKAIEYIDAAMAQVQMGIAAGAD